VVADDRCSAEDALDSIYVEYENLPVVSDPEEALTPSSAHLYEDWGSNQFMNGKFSNGDVADESVTQMM
jgi:aerobic carbon-monoxide dehydrogenase large subunit